MELKPCPKCQSKPKLCANSYHRKTSYGYVCSNPKCVLSFACVGYSDQEEALDDWNKKVEWEELLQSWSERLHPCDCGGKAKLVFEQYGRAKFWFVRCDDCQKLLTPSESIDAIIESWNRRNASGINL